jgi:adenosylhomocysteine nucleosidase
MTRPILILSALTDELEALRGSMTDTAEVRFGGRSYRIGSIDGVHVVVGTVGVGKVNAAMVAALAMERFTPRLLLFTGVAGGLDPTLEIGDVVVAERVVQHDTGISGPDGFQPYQAGHLPFFNPTNRLGFRPSPALLVQTREALNGVEFDEVLGRTPRVVFGTVATGDQFIEAEADRRMIHEVFGAHAAEMEGAAAAQVAEAFGIDCLVVRALSDLAGSGSDADFDRFLSEVSVNSIKVVRAVLSAVSAGG